ncbi:MAG: (Fe-S)-binding protein, partial [Anaerolineae bacterium]|nr:(Fe-S)-binding protein [Anaerolineae bacterium]
MLTLIERILFAIATVISLYYTYRGVQRITKNISGGQGKIDWSLAWKRIGDLIAKVIFFQPVFRFRLGPSLFHAFVGWGFFVYLLINISDLIYAYTGFKILENSGLFGDVYRLLADFLGVGILIGLASLAFRRYVLRPRTLTTRESTLLHPKARTGIQRDSAIVTTTFFTHNLMRLLGESFHLALQRKTDSWQPIISAVSGLWSGVNANALMIGEHITFWLSIGAVVAFLPYFAYSKHIHLFFAPINFA